MTRKSVGYFEGTDSTLLTALVLEGYDTLPMSNGRDSHGRHVRLLNDKERVDLLISYPHKLFAPDESIREKTDVTFQDVFHICRTYDIPLLLEVPEALQPQAIQLFQDPPDIVKFVDPADMFTVARSLLTGS